MLKSNQKYNQEQKFLVQFEDRIFLLFIAILFLSIITASYLSEKNHLNFDFSGVMFSFISLTALSIPIVFILNEIKKKRIGKEKSNQKIDAEYENLEIEVQQKPNKAIEKLNLEIKEKEKPEKVELSKNNIAETKNIEAPDIPINKSNPILNIDLIDCEEMTTQSFEKKPAIFNQNKNEKKLDQQITDLFDKVNPKENKQNETSVNKKQNTLKKKGNSEEEQKFKEELGDLGEEFIMNYERKKLQKFNFEISENLVHTSKVVGDSAGFDIQSLNKEGEPIFIEVKTTTRKDYKTPFYLTKNELQKLKTYKENYLIYRVYNFDKNQNIGKIKIITADLLLQHLNLEPEMYRIKRKQHA